MFNFLFKRKDQQLKTNTLDAQETGEALLDGFIQFAKKATESRRAVFDQLIPFALESEQWTGQELREKNNKEDRALTFNFSNEYIERYMARLFPRNPQTGIMDLGVKVHETNHAKKEKQEQ